MSDFHAKFNRISQDIPKEKDHPVFSALSKAVTVFEDFNSDNPTYYEGYLIKFYDELVMSVQKDKNPNSNEALLRFREEYSSTIKHMNDFKAEEMRQEAESDSSTSELNYHL